MTLASAELKRKTGDGTKTAAAGPLSAEERRKMHGYWRAANYLSVGQIRFILSAGHASTLLYSLRRDPRRVEAAASGVVPSHWHPAPLVGGAPRHPAYEDVDCGVPAK